MLRLLASPLLALAACAPVPERPAAPDKGLEAGHDAAGAVAADRPTEAPPTTAPTMILVRSGVNVACTSDHEAGVRAWIQAALDAGPVQLRRRITRTDWDEARSADALQLTLPGSPGSPGAVRTAVLPLPPHAFAGWLLLEEDGALRSPFVVGGVEDDVALP